MIVCVGFCGEVVGVIGCVGFCGEVVGVISCVGFCGELVNNGFCAEVVMVVGEGCGDGDDGHGGSSDKWIGR